MLVGGAGLRRRSGASGDPKPFWRDVWLEEIEEKCAVKHGVRPEEVEEVFRRSPRVSQVEKGYRPGEDVYVARGRTAAGRYLMVFFIRKLDGSALIVSARDVTRRERRAYGR